MLCCGLADAAQEQTDFKELKPGQTHALVMSLDDKFIIRGSETWSIAIGKELALDFGEVSIIPRQGTDFKLNLRFMCDTKDLARYDTPQKMKAATARYAKQFVAESVEKKADLVEMDVNGRYGFVTTLTDASLADVQTPASGEFKYLTIGMIRLSDDSALVFTLMTNDTKGKPHGDAMDYVKSFVKPAKGATTQPDA